MSHCDIFEGYTVVTKNGNNRLGKIDTTTSSKSIVSYTKLHDNICSANVVFLAWVGH